jgi:tRNA(fMet)-specific endonuclease VapC
VVVATEVRSLAHRVTAAAKEVRHLIGADIAVSSITVMEIAYGLARNAPRARKIAPLIDTLLASLNLLPYSEADARETGRIRAELESAGSPIGLCDAMLAGVARSRELQVITHNLDEFLRVSGLRTDDWRHATGG